MLFVSQEAPATGALRRTVNNGTTFEPMLPEKSALSVVRAALALPGEYTVVLEIGGKTCRTRATVRQAPEFD